MVTPSHKTYLSGQLPARAHPPYRFAVERALLGYIVVFELLLTLSPFHFAWPALWRIAWWSDWRDFPANVLLFVPVGYFFILTLAPTHPRRLAYALLFGTAFSTVIEALQLFLPARVTALTDVLGNGLGAVAGAVLCNAVRRRLRRRLPSALTLEHPLLNVVYLMVPLMWLAGIELGASPQHVWLVAPLGAVGALTLTGLWRYRFAAAAGLPRPLVALMVLAWFLIGATTALISAPLVVTQCAVGVTALALAVLYLPRPPDPAPRRFEYKVLAAIWPVYLVYLLLQVVTPPISFGAFHAQLGYPLFGFDRHIAVRVAEQIAALTLCGYLVAESCGRSRLAAPWLIVRNIALAITVALALELCHGFVPFDRASVMRWALSSLGSAFGAALYAAQMNVVQVLRGQLPRA